MADDNSNESVIDGLRGPKKGVTGGGVPSSTTGDSVTKSTNNPVLQGPVQRPGATQTALQQQIAANPYPTVDPNAGFGTHLLAAGQQIGRGVANVGRVFGDEFTHGFYDKNQVDPDVARAKTQQASDELGLGGNLGIRTMANIANPINKLAEGGGLIKSGIQGGITGGLDAYGHGGTLLDTAWGAGTGAVVGSGLSTAGKAIYQAARKYAPSVGENLLAAAQKIGLRPGGGTTSSVTQDTKAAANAAFQQVDQNNYHSPHVLNAANQIDTSVLNNPIVRTASPGTHSVLTDFQKDLWDNVQKGAPTTAGDIHTQIKALDDVIARGGQDGASAMKAKQQLTGLYSTLPPTNNTASAVVDQFNKANAAHSTYQNAKMLGGMESDLGVFGKMPAAKAQAELDPKTGNPNFYKGPGQTEAMTNIGQSADKAPGVSAYGTIAGGSAGGYFGHPLLGGVGGAIYDASKLVDSPAAARSAIYDAYPALTGANPVNPETAVTEALKRPALGMLSSGEGKPNPIDMVPGALSPFVFPYMMGQ